MTILVDFELDEALDNGEIILDPLDKSLINSQSIDFRLGNTFSRMTRKNGVVNPQDPESFGFIPFEAEYIILEPGEFILASSLEKITLAPSIATKVHGKSSLGRLGIINSSHAGWVDGGFSNAYITLELFNSGPFPIRLNAGLKIGQLVFHRTEIPNVDYSKKGRYNNQGQAFGSLGVN